ncbi:DUF4394 domain-containing protein [Chroococcus sp. FPU101]|uniref:DUF4394 domain-containing protein n=1 Tax=Chroococcus sp. FPU101 TaxID=1974212 RepID=UPI001A909C0B|nr:DUF4394 domain-containing protein [Chroococcus sp. FPU101]GFE69196.1 hypothetical protein CFPU101_18060 [Chroococcus sp. FPU101]
MKLDKNSQRIAALAVATVFTLLATAQSSNASSIQLIGLDNNNNLFLFDSNNSSQTQTRSVTGITGNLLGIDFRPADNQLYGLTDTSNIYTINTATGAATFVSSLSTAFTSGFESGIDFNPVPDRLRIVGSNNQNLRVDVATGATTVDGTLAYGTGDVNVGVEPNLTAAAYTNSFSPSPAPNRTTELFGIDFGLDILVQQNPPNAGTLNTVGSLGVDFGSTGGFDILSTQKGNNITNMAFAASGSSLYTINLSTGAATTVGTIGNGNVTIVGLAARTVPEPSTIGALLGFLTFGVMTRFRRRLK